MYDVEVRSTSDYKRTWLPFDGTYERIGNIARIRPHADPRCYAEVRAENVREEGNALFLLLGGSILSFRIPADSPFAAPGDGVGHAGCTLGQTRCFGSVETCCTGKKQIVGSCAGAWGCPP